MLSLIVLARTDLINGWTRNRGPSSTHFTLVEIIGGALLTLDDSGRRPARCNGLALIGPGARWLDCGRDWRALGLVARH
jgi:hypothetical protein